MHGKYTCTFFSNEIARVSFNKSQQTNFAGKGCKILSLPNATWRGAMSLKPSEIKRDNFLYVNIYVYYIYIQILVPGL